MKQSKNYVYFLINTLAHTFHEAKKKKKTVIIIKFGAYGLTNELEGKCSGKNVNCNTRIRENFKTVFFK